MDLNDAWINPEWVVKVISMLWRKRLADIGGMADLIDETRSELDKLKLEYSDNDSRRAALVISEDAPKTHVETRSSEGREFRALALHQKSWLNQKSSV